MAVGGKFLGATSASYKPLSESLLLFACRLLQGKFSKKFKCLVKYDVCSCKSSSRWFKFSKELHEDVCACFNVINKGKC